MKIATNQDMVMVALMDGEKVLAKELPKITGLDRKQTDMGLYQLRHKGFVYNDKLNGWYLSTEGEDYIRENQTRMIKATDENLVEKAVEERVEVVSEPSDGNRPGSSKQSS